MTHRLLIPTFYNDLHNFKICVKLLDKYWAGNKALTVVYSLILPNSKLINKNEIVSFIEKELAETLNDWDYTIKPAPQTKMLSGWEEQQCSKLYYSQEHTEDYTVVFDCKDFIHSTMFFEDFFVNGKMKVTPLAANCNSFINKCNQLFDLTNNKFHPDPLSPWVWENNVLKQLYQFLVIKFGPHETWENFPGYEYMNYYYYKENVLKQDLTTNFSITDDKNMNIFQCHRIRDLSNLKYNGDILSKIGISNEDIIEWQLSSIKMANFELISRCNLDKYITNLR